MKSYFLLIIAALGYFHTTAQDKILGLNGGYVTANIRDRDTNANGYRINLIYEIEPAVGSVIHGFSLGFINVKTDVVEYSGGQPINYNYSITTWPFYYAPKFMIGKGSFQGFVKAALGMQFSTLKLTSPTDVFTSTDAGLYAGLGAGVRKSLKSNLSINLEYEWSYLSNSYYNDGFAHSVMLGVGKILN